MEKIKKILLTTAAAIGFLALIIGFMFLSVGFTVYNKAFYEFEFRKSKVDENIFIFTRYDGTALEISRGELDKVRDKLIGYFSGKDDSLQTMVIFDGNPEPIKFYTDFEAVGEDNEISHMADVLVVFNAVRLAGWILLPAGLALAAVSCIFSNKGERLRKAARGTIVGAITFIGVLGFIGIAMLIDFSGAFWVFHEVFFPQGNWSFPASSNMLGILQESLFMNAAFIILGCGVGFAVILLIAGLVIKLKTKKLEIKT